MATAEETKDESKAGEGTKGTEAGQKPAVEPPPTKPEGGAAKAAAKDDKKPDAKGEGGTTKKDPVSLKDDEDIPDDAELLTLSPGALNKRLQRSSNAQLKEHFGTSDVAAIKKKLERLDELEKEKEERRVAALDKEAQQEERAKKAEERAAAAEAKAAALAEDRLVESEEGHLKELASSHIKPKYWKHVSRDLAEHLRDNYTEKELNGVKDKVLNKWFADYVKENPEYAKGDAADDKKADVKKETLDNGAKDEGRPGSKASPNAAVKTFKPGQANSMSTQEAKQEAAKQGYRW